MTESERPIIVGMFLDRNDAQRAVNELRRTNFREDQIGIVTRYEGGIPAAEVPSADAATHSKIVEGSAVGAATGAGIGAIDAQAPGYIGPHSGQSTWIYFHWPQCLISPPITLVFQDGNSQAKFSPNNPPYNTITFPTAPPLTISHW